MRPFTLLPGRNGIRRRAIGIAHPVGSFRLSAVILAPLALLAVLIVVMVGPPRTPALLLVADGTAVSPDQPLRVVVPPLRLTLTAAVLREDPSDARPSESPAAVPVVMQPSPAPLPWQPAEVGIVLPDGGNPLRPDRFYHLSLTGKWNILALPWLSVGDWRVEYHFTTLPSPKPVLPSQPLHPRYGQPIPLQWDMPVTDVQYRVVPDVAASVAFDPVDRSRANLTLHGYAPGETYQVTVTAATGSDGIQQQQPWAVDVVMPKPPTPAVAGRRIIPLGQPLALHWDEPLVDFAYRLDPPDPSVGILDPADHRHALVTLQKLHQGQQYTLTVTGATAEIGTQLHEPRTFTFTSPGPVRVVDKSPANDAFGLRPDLIIGLTFGEPVAGREAAQRAFSVSPAVPGRFEWPSQRELRFVPAAPFPFGTKVTVRLAGGPHSVRSESGGYLEQDLNFQFTTRPDKLIDVDLSRQVVTLTEGDRIVLTTLTSTGVRGAETPTGTFMVQYKLKSTRMRGVTPSGARYDIPDVPWVLAFSGDYTIHGAYWRNGFGFPQSNGCVSLPVPVAEQIFEWAPRGTPIYIHY